MTKSTPPERVTGSNATKAPAGYATISDALIAESQGPVTMAESSSEPYDPNPLRPPHVQEAIEQGVEVTATVDLSTTPSTAPANVTPDGSPHFARTDPDGDGMVCGTDGKEWPCPGYRQLADQYRSDRGESILPTNFGPLAADMRDIR